MNANQLIGASSAMRGDEWNNLDLNLGSPLLIAIIAIGVVGLAIEQGMNLIARRFDYRSH